MKRTNILLSVALIVVAILAGCTAEGAYPAFPTTATIKQVGDFIKGQDFDSSKFEVVVKYLDGSSQTMKNAVLTNDVDATTGVVAGNTVYINVGKDYNGNAVEANGKISRVYPVAYITATTDKAVFEKGTANPQDFVVTAYYGNTKEVLSTAYYGVSVAIDPEAMTEEGYEEATEVPGIATVVINFGSEVGTEVPVTVSKDATTAPTGEVVSISQVSSVDFKFAQYAYEELPAIDPAKVTMWATTDEQKTGGVTADKIEGIELAYVNADGNIVDPTLDNIDMSSITKDGNSGIKIQATWNGKTYVSNEIMVAETKIKLEYKGNGYVGGTLLDDIDLKASDFRATLFIDEKIAEFDPALADENFYFVSDTDSMPVVETSGTDGVWVAVKYNGVILGNIEGAFIPSLKEGEATISDVTFTMDDTFKVAKQYYTDLSALNVPSNLVKDFTITMSDGEKSHDATGWAFALYTAEDVEAKVPSTLGTADAYDGLVNLDTVYVGATKGAEAFFVPVELSDAEVTEVVLTAAYPVYEDKTTPAINDKITWNVQLAADKGYVFDGNVDDLGSAYGEVLFFQNGKSISALPETVTAEAQNGFQIKVGANASEKVNTVAGRAWVDVTEFTVTQAETYIAYFDDVIETDSKYYTLAETGYTKVGEVTSSDLPKITLVTPIIEGAVVEDGSTVDVTVSYLGKSGKTETAVVEDVKITGTAYVAAGTLNIGNVALSGTSEASPKEIANGTYDESDFVGYTAHGTGAGPTYKVEAVGDSGVVISGTQFTLASEKDVVKISVTYTPKNAAEKTDVYYAKGTVVPTTEA